MWNRGDGGQIGEAILVLFRVVMGTGPFCIRDIGCGSAHLIESMCRVIQAGLVQAGNLDDSGQMSVFIYC
ncbi:MAG: hypothetical protein JXA42_26460 [Anaerolineales bacterium]|nr:hypothetical protein [Anaerolineales bacterium]